ncbi:MAG TPA: TetR/AcrR family transcriptional regulator [Desulfocapsa sulfexigens]|nr:TetR/AcrR family transcriptional regulator [Desulfocapsa sulfexigens]
MARGQKIDHQELHATILTVATQIIKDEGMKSLSIRKVAKEIGCAVGTIYNIFNSIDDIFLTINAATMTRLYKQLQQEAQEESDPLTASVMLGRAYVAFSRDNYHLWSLLVDHKLQPGSTLPVNVQEKIDDLFLLVSGMVAPLVSNDKGKADLAAKVLWASLHGVCSLAMSGKLDTVKAEATDVLAESLVRNYLQGLQVK